MSMGFPFPQFPGVPLPEFPVNVMKTCAPQYSPESPFADPQAWMKTWAAIATPVWALGLGHYGPPQATFLGHWLTVAPLPAFPLSGLGSLPHPGSASVDAPFQVPAFPTSCLGSLPHPGIASVDTPVQAPGAQARGAVRVRGLPFSATEGDVLAFFAVHDVVDHIADVRSAVKLLKKPNGRPSGQAVVELHEPSDIDLVVSALHNQWMGSRFIEVFPVRVEENTVQSARQEPATIVSHATGSKS